MAAISLGVDFRATLGYVTDPDANYYAELGPGNDYPVSFGGTTIGWESGFVGGNSRDRTTAHDVRLAGVNFTNVAQATFRVDLPGPGTYTINLAVGDGTNGFPSQKLELFDNITSLGVLCSGAVSGGSFFDATNTLVDSSTWSAENTVDGGGSAAITKTFSSSICRFTLGDGANIGVIASLYIAGSGTIVSDVLMPQIIL